MLLLVSNLHAPGAHRVNGVVANMPEFHEDFGVKPGDGPRFAQPRVKIW